MSTGPSYRVSFRRRREGKTDYQQRRNLVLSGLPRLVVRGSLRNVSVQLIRAEVGGDKVIVSAHSNELAKNYGWKGGGGSLPAAYLTGVLCGYKAAAKNTAKAVLDMGLQAPSKGSRVFAVLRGVLDAGLEIPHSEEKLPDEKRVQGMHIVEYAKQLTSVQDAYQKQFARQLSRGLRPEELTNNFSQVKEKVCSAFQEVEVPKAKVEDTSQKAPVEQKKKAVRGATAKKTSKPKTRSAQKKQEKPEEKK